jgi:hypothetical protein
MCYGTYLRATRILAGGGYDPEIEPYLLWSVDTKGKRIGNPDL